MRFLAAALGLLVTLVPRQLPVVQLPPEQTFAEWLVAFRAEASAFYYNYKGLQLSRIVARTSVNDNTDAGIYPSWSSAIVHRRSSC